MPVWETIPVDEQPELTLVQWSVRQLPNGDRHLVGWVAENREGRVSSRIVSFDPTNMRGVTRSGRIYQLVGNQGINMDAEHTWAVWCRINKVNAWEPVDPTGESEAAHRTDAI